MTTLLFFVGVFCGILLAGFLHIAGDSDMEQELAIEQMKRKKAETELKLLRQRLLKYAAKEKQRMNADV